MSTFDGIVKEFPDIRIDRFAANDTTGSRPLAYFLSHVHTDHLVGIEGINGPFVYCSPATREILLKLEKYPHRLNFATGILEQRVVRYKRLKKLLKAVPLEAPTTIELAGNRTIRVTLFDANHCIGAVMFLIEDESNAILYTGDIRSEMWWVNSLIRNPLLLPYVAAVDHEPLQRLDAIYLDTTFASKEDPYRQFPPKASGVMELLRKIKDYPEDTLFYFDAWTYGYEEVLQALSTFLRCQIHVDDYRWRIYSSLMQSDELCDAKIRAPEAPKLVGYQCGNHLIRGCLTTEQTRIHSCERGTGCSIWHKQFVRITPIVSRHEGKDMPEHGAGGGHGDLNQQHELEIFDDASVSALMKICVAELQDQPHLLSGVMQMLTQAMEHPRKVISLDASDLSQDEDVFEELDELPLGSIPAALAKRVARIKLKANCRTPTTATSSGLPKQITFPYSRHSSFTELCLLIEAFKPKDIFPCTVDTEWSPAQSMGYLFGHLYDQPPVFRHDQFMLQRAEQNAKTGRAMTADRNRYSQNTQEYECAVADTERTGEVSPPHGRRRSAVEAENDMQAVEKAAKRRKVSRGDYWPTLDVKHKLSGQEGRLRSSSAAEEHLSSTRPSAATVNRRSRRSTVTMNDELGSGSALQAERNRTPTEAGERSSPHHQIIGWQRRAVKGRREASPRREQLNLGLSRSSHRGTQASLFKPSRRLSLSLEQPANYGRLSPPDLDDVCNDCATRDKPNLTEGKRLFVGDLPAGISADELREFFDSKGFRVTDIVLPDFVKNRNHGFLNMRTSVEAATAIRQLNGTVLGGHTIRLRLATVNANRPSSDEVEATGGRRLFVGNLASSIDAEKLEGVFISHGFCVKNVEVPTHTDSGRPKSYGFVDVPSAEEAGRAIHSLNGLDVERRKIRIQLGGKGDPQEIPGSVTNRANLENSQDTGDAQASQETKDELDEEELKLGLKMEAYAAALGEGELTWSEIGLVSVNGHQLKEEEL